MNSSTYRGVQALRGIAALSVMLFHFRWNLNVESPALGDKLFGWGASGVDLFFLISGFVITLSAARTPGGVSGALKFLKKRALRILPAYYIILLPTFFVSGAMSTFHYADKTENFISALTFMPIYPEYAPFYIDDDGMYGIRWTLNYEVYFYLAMGLMIATGKRWLSAAVFFTATLIIFPLYMWRAFSFEPSGYETASPLLGLITNPMILLFLTGMILGLILPKLQWMSPKIMASAALCIIVFTGYNFSHGIFTGHGLLGSGWLYALLLASIVLAENYIGKFIPATLVWLGNISFSLYLIHTLLNAGLGKRLEKLGVEDGYERFFLSIIISSVLAWLSWRYIETPFLRKKTNSR